MPRDFDRQAFMVSNLIELGRAKGCVPLHVVQAAAEMLGVHERTLRRWIAAGAPPPPNAKEGLRFTPTEAHIDLYVECRGNVTAVHEALVKEGGDIIPSRRTLARAFDRLPATQRASARFGPHGRRKHEVYFTQVADYRNAVWQTDHKELPVAVIPPPIVGTKPRKPWITVFIDDYSRAIVGYAVSYQPTAAEVIAAFHAAVLVDPDWGPFGGVPETLICDNGLEFLSDSFAEVVLTLGTDLRPTNPHCPEHKGKVERWNWTLDQRFTSKLLGYQHGPRRRDGTLVGPDRLLTDRELRTALREFIYEYNHSHPNRMVGGQTPLERWEADATPLRTFTPDELAWMARPSKTAKVLRGAIQFQRTRFIHSALATLDGETVEIRYMPHDNRSIDVFRDGQHICCAEAEGRLSPDEHAAIESIRREERKREAQHSRRASRNQAARLAPMTDASGVEVSRTMPIDDAADDRAALRRARRPRQRRPASGDSLLNQPIEDE